MSTKLANRPAVLKYLKKKCKGFDESRIFVTHKHDGMFQLVVAIDGKKLHAESFYDASWALDLLIPRIEGCLENGYWDKDTYYQPYTSDPKDVKKNIPFGPIIRCPGDGSRVIDSFRKANKPHDIGFEEVPPTKNFVYFA